MALKCANFERLPEQVRVAIAQWVAPRVGIHSSAHECIQHLIALQQIAQAWGGECLSTEYKGIGVHLTFRCVMGHHWQKIPSLIVAGHFCPVCNSRSQKALRANQNLAESRGWTCLSTEFVNSSTPLRWRCAQGHEWSSTPGSARANKAGCPVCYREKHYYKLEDMQRFAKNKGGECLSIAYRNVNYRLTWQCRRGHVWHAVTSRVLGGSWCPECAILDRVYKQDSKARQKYEPSNLHRPDMS